VGSILTPVYKSSIALPVLRIAQQEYCSSNRLRIRRSGDFAYCEGFRMKVLDYVAQINLVIIICIRY
jgi:hypothetical protein